MWNIQQRVEACYQGLHRAATVQEPRQWEGKIETKALIESSALDGRRGEAGVGWWWGGPGVKAPEEL